MTAQTILPTDKPMIITTRVINAPRELVFKVLTDPNHIAEYWGPNGFTNTIKSMDVKPGGQWLYTMHGPDGTDWPNRIIYRTVEPPRLLTFDHDNGGDGPNDHRFKGEIELWDEGGKTRIELRMIEKNIEARDAIVGYATEGGRQNLDRLAAHIDVLQAAPKDAFIISRSFPVSRQRLYEACSNADELLKWFSPRGAKSIKAELDLRPGGTFFYGNQMPDGSIIYGKSLYVEILPNEKIVYYNRFSDEQGNIISHPMAPTWPMELHTTFLFADEGKTNSHLTIIWNYDGSDPIQKATFMNAMVGMRGGWTGTLDGLTNYFRNA